MDILKVLRVGSKLKDPTPENILDAVRIGVSEPKKKPMNLLNAFRVGVSVTNPTPIKWGGLFLTLSVVGLEVVQSLGYLQEITATDVIDISVLILILISQIITTDKIGVLPKPKAALPELAD